MKILLVDDHALFREGMHYIVSQLGEQVDILDAGCFSEAMTIAGNNPDLDLVMLDLKMPDSEGVGSVNLFHSRYPRIPIVVVSGTDYRGDIESAMNSGAMGFISKASASKDMVQALRVVLDGGIYLPPQLLLQAVARVEGGRKDGRSWRVNRFGLTARQMEVLQHLAHGMSNKGIALATGLAEGTVKVHVAAIYQALKVGNRNEATRAALKLGLVEDRKGGSMKAYPPVQDTAYQ
ncbi:MAG: response regulator transcription factor [Betaproteobacteria bacterium]|nr:response regulator transcription factor [Betaproteobacteria bacterium]MDE2311291.1 response regulator transcription factor [Betaproteobacteria bacterium]